MANTNTQHGIWKASAPSSIVFARWKERDDDGGVHAMAQTNRKIPTKIHADTVYSHTNENRTEENNSRKKKPNEPNRKHSLFMKI